MATLCRQCQPATWHEFVRKMEGLCCAYFKTGTAGLPDEVRQIIEALDCFAEADLAERSGFLYRAGVLRRAGRLLIPTGETLISSLERFGIRLRDAVACPQLPL